MRPEHTNPVQPRLDRDRIPHFARAPYNFIPLPERVVEARIPYDQDSYTAGATGWIECEMQTCSPTYVRGMLTETQYREFGKLEPEFLKAEHKEQMAPFFSRCKHHSEGRHVPVIPGATLRGMIRSLVEVIGYCRVRWVAPGPVVTFRAVAAQSEDPLKRPYDAVMGRFGSNVRAGYLEKRGEEWWIRPAMTPRSVGWPSDEGYLKINETQIGGKDIPRFLRLNSEKYMPQWHQVTFDVEVRNGKRGPYTAVTRIGSPTAGFGISGSLVCSGNMLEAGVERKQKSRRKKHAIVLAQDKSPDAQPRKISDQAIKDYLNGLTPFQRGLDYWSDGHGCLGDGAPVFYVLEGNEVTYFGHSPFFRIPARLAVQGTLQAATPNDFIPAELRKIEGPDLADAIFGWVEGDERDGLKGHRGGRVFFCDAHYTGNGENIWLNTGAITPRTLSSPKPTTFQHYLVQDKRLNHNPDDKKSLAHFGTPPTETRIRGHKFYWHKGAEPEIEATSQDLKHEKQLTRMCPVKPGVPFRFRIYFENLRDEELGALYWALSLPGEAGKAYRHKLGMGKPLGMGSVSLKPRLFLTDRRLRYKSLFKDEGWYQAEDKANPQEYIQSFENFVRQALGIGPGRLADIDRIKMLLTMLEWREGDPEWIEKTRYMQIEREIEKEKVSEYKERPVLPDPLGVVSSKINSTPPLRTNGPGPSRSASPKPTIQRRQDPAIPQKGSEVKAKVIQIDGRGNASLHIEGFAPEKAIGKLASSKMAGKKYAIGDAGTFVIAGIKLSSGKMVIDCKPYAHAGYEP